MLHKYLIRGGLSGTVGTPTGQSSCRELFAWSAHRLLLRLTIYAKSQTFRGNNDKAYKLNEVPVCFYLLEVKMPPAW